MEGVKKDNEKLPMGIVIQRQFPNALKAIAKCSLYGHNKYEETDLDWMNFERLENAEERYFNALFRHLLDCGLDLDKKDSESELPHIYHVVWNAMALLELLTKNKKDD
jgi:hypothetical protein